MATFTIPLAVYCAFFGALAIKLINLLEMANVPPVSRVSLRDWLYWASFLVMPLIGGGLALIYVLSDVALKPIVAVNIGVSAPLILKTMAAAVPKSINPGVGA